MALMCEQAGIRGDGVLETITGHSLRGTMIQWRRDARYSPTVISERTGHRDIGSYEVIIIYAVQRGKSSKNRYLEIWVTKWKRMRRMRKTRLKSNQRIRILKEKSGK